VSLEQHADLAETARARLAAQQFSNVRVLHADALTWETTQRFDAICVTAAVDTIPAKFLTWLRPGGRLFIVRGRAPAMEAVLVSQHSADINPDVNTVTTQSLFETELPYLTGAAPSPEFTL